MASRLTRPAPARRDAPFTGRGRSEQRGEAYSVPYVEPLSDARTPLADCFRILLSFRWEPPQGPAFQSRGPSTTFTVIPEEGSTP